MLTIKYDEMCSIERDYLKKRNASRRKSHKSQSKSSIKSQVWHLLSGLSDGSVMILCFVAAGVFIWISNHKVDNCGRIQVNHHVVLGVKMLPNVEKTWNRFLRTRTDTKRGKGRVRQITIICFLVREWPAREHLRWLVINSANLISKASCAKIMPREKLKLFTESYEHWSNW